MIRSVLNIADNRLKKIVHPLHERIDLRANWRKERLKYLGGKYKLVPLSAFSAAHNLTVRLCEPAKTTIWRGPKFSGNPEVASDITQFVRVEQPALQITEIPNAIALAASNIFLVGNRAVHSDYFQADRDVCMLERYHYIRIEPKRQKLFYYHSLPPVRMPPAVSLLGQSAGNYAHFLVEVLPRLFVVDEFDDYKGMPLLVDSWIHKNHLAAVKLFNARHRSIVRCGTGQPAHPATVIDVSTTAYAPPEYRSFVERGEIEFTPAEDYVFNVTALNMVRDAALRKRPRSSEYGERILILRKTEEFGNGRQVLNISPIIRAALKAGFKIVEPSGLTIREQIQIFRNARIVISPVGAALANLIFTPPGCQVICLSAVFEGANYFYFSNLMEALGHNMKYVIGQQKISPKGHLFHHNYFVDIDAFYSALKEVVNNS